MFVISKKLDDGLGLLFFSVFCHGRVNVPVSMVSSVLLRIYRSANRSRSQLHPNPEIILVLTLQIIGRSVVCNVGYLRELKVLQFFCYTRYFTSELYFVSYFKFKQMLLRSL